MSETLGQRVRRARLEKGMSQQELASPDLSKSLISLIENDRLRPSLKTLHKISDRLQKPLTYFFEVEGVLSSKDLRLLLAMGETDSMRGRFPQAIETFTAASNLAKSLGDVRAQFRAMMGMGICYRESDHLDKAEEALEQAYALAKNGGDGKAIARVLVEQAHLAMRQSRYRQALGAIHSALQALDEHRLPDPSLRTHALMLRGTIYGQLGQLNEAITSFEDALAASAGTGDLTKLGELYSEIGATYRASGSLDEALRFTQQAREIFETLEDLKRVGMVSRNLGIILMERGEPQSALPHLERSLRITEQIGSNQSRAYTLTELSRCKLALGDVQGARKACEEAMTAVADLNDRTERGRAELVMAQISDAEGKLDQAIAHSRAALEIFEQVGVAAELARARVELGRLLLKKGEPTEAAPILWQALEGLGALRKGLVELPQKTRVEDKGE